MEQTFRASFVYSFEFIVVMAGHNKWSKVKHVKGAADAKRGRLFSRLSREISLAARMGGGDATMNARLRTAVANARAQNMPGDTIERAIKKGTGELGGEALEEILYEGYAPGGVAMLVEAATDNKNRTAAEIRLLFSKHNGNLGTSGSVAYLFHRKGQIVITGSGLDEDTVLEAAIECGADEMQPEEGQFLIFSAPDKLGEVADALRQAGFEPTSQSLVFVPETLVTITDESKARQILRLCDALDECDDVQNVFSNFEISDEILARIA